MDRLRRTKPGPTAQAPARRPLHRATATGLLSRRNPGIDAPGAGNRTPKDKTLRAPRGLVPPNDKPRGALKPQASPPLRADFAGGEVRGYLPRDKARLKTKVL